MRAIATPVVFILIVEALGLAIGAAFGPQPGGWYDGLAKPPLTPPGWVFPVAWTLLYAMMGLAASLVWSARSGSSSARNSALVAFAVQLALNLAWTPIFFGAELLGPAVVATIALLIAAAVAAWLMGRVDRRAAWLMIPYLVWVCFALYLTVWIWSANA